jgi:hypothetical protein
MLTKITPDPFEALFFTARLIKIEESNCVTCENRANKFRTRKSKEIYEECGICEDCQNYWSSQGEV